LVYPAFVIASFIGVMVLMMTLVIPKLADIIEETQQAIPWYTKLIIGTSDFLVHYGIFLLLVLAAGGVLLWRYGISAVGKQALSELKLQVPYLGLLYRKLYLSRISDNLSTMVESGISMLRALEITAEVVDSEVYKNILKEASLKVKAGPSACRLPRDTRDYCADDEGGGGVGQVRLRALHYGEVLRAGSGE